MVASAAIVFPRFLDVPVGPLPTRGRGSRRRRQEEGGAPRFCPAGLFLVSQGGEGSCPGPFDPLTPAYAPLFGALCKWLSRCMANGVARFSGSFPSGSRARRKAFVFKSTALYS